MIRISKTNRPDVVEEMRHLVNNYLIKHGPLSGLMMELNHEEYIDPMYIREKIALVKSTMDALDRDLSILERDAGQP